MNSVTRPLHFSERVALFVVATRKEKLDELFAGFEASSQKRATHFSAALSACDSAQRQARLSLEFGPRFDAAERLQTVVVEAHPHLRAAIVEALPTRWKVLFPQFQSSSNTVAPAMRALASRLALEAQR